MSFQWSHYLSVRTFFFFSFFIAGTSFTCIYRIGVCMLLNLTYRRRRFRFRTTKLGAFFLSKLLSVIYHCHANVNLALCLPQIYADSWEPAIFTHQSYPLNLCHGDGKYNNLIYRNRVFFILANFYTLNQYSSLQKCLNAYNIYELLKCLVECMLLNSRNMIDVPFYDSENDAICW